MTISSLPAKINLTESNTQLAGLQARSYDKAFKTVPNSVLPSVLLAQLQVCFTALTEQEMKPDGTTLAVKSVGGVYSRMYAPSVYKGEGENILVIRWGDDFINIKGESGQGPGAPKYLYPENSSRDIWNPAVNTEVEASLSFSNFAGPRGTDTCLKLSVFNAEYPDGLEMFFSCWLNDSEEFQNVNSEALNDMLRRGRFSVISGFFKPIPTGTKLEGETVKLTELPPAVYKVTGFKVIAGSYGNKAIAQFMPPEPGEEGFSTSDVTGVNAPLQVWLNNALSLVLIANNPKLSVDKPAKLYLRSVTQMSNGKMKADAGIVLPQEALTIVEGGLNLDF